MTDEFTYLDVLQRLRCPQCGETMRARNSKSWTCRRGHRAEWDAHGFLSFSPGRDDFFETHWSDFKLDTIPLHKLMVGQQFLAEIDDANSEDSVVLDVGCGDGTQLVVLDRMTGRSRLVGVDISEAGLGIAHARVPGALLIHADARTLPFEDETFDAVFSYGVLSYMENASMAVSELFRVTKSEGRVGIWVFPPPTGQMGVSLLRIRKAFARLPRHWQSFAVNLLIPWLTLLPTSSGVSLSSAGWHACREALMVSLAPTSLTFVGYADILEMTQSRGEVISGIGDCEQTGLWFRRT